MGVGMQASQGGVEGGTAQSAPEPRLAFISLPMSWQERAPLSDPRNWLDDAVHLKKNIFY